MSTSLHTITSGSVDKMSNNQKLSERNKKRDIESGRSLVLTYLASKASIRIFLWQNKEIIITPMESFMGEIFVAS